MAAKVLVLMTAFVAAFSVTVAMSKEVAAEDENDWKLDVVDNHLWINLWKFVNGGFVERKIIECPDPTLDCFIDEDDENASYDDCPSVGCYCVDNEGAYFSCAMYPTYLTPPLTP